MPDAITHKLKALITNELKALWFLIKCILCLLLITFVSLVGIAVYYSYFYPIPSLIVNLPGNSGPAVAKSFTQRLAQRFPIGSTESDLIHELALERFQRMTENGVPQRAELYDDINDKPFFDFCRLEATINWSANDAGGITAISGDVFETCP